jgi:hypothetical protein
MENFRYLVDRQSAEKSQFHDPALLRVQSLQTFESVIKRDQVNITRFGEIDGFLQRKLGYRGAAFRGAMFPGVVDQNAPHQLGCDTNELRPVLPSGVLLVHQLEVRLVN